MTEKLRLAIGVFEQPLVLIKAVDELLSQGFSERDLCISGSRDAVLMTGDLLCAQSHPNPHTLNLLANTLVYPTTVSTQHIVGSKGSLLSKWCQVVEPAKQPSTQIDLDGSKTMWSQMMKMINKGCLILMVQTNQTNQLSRAATLLLKSSTNTVQTLECRSPVLDTPISREG